jgi:DNA-binding NtrC family response regulator
VEQETTAILVVDDDPVALEVIQVNLRGHGFEPILTAVSGEQALEIVRSRSVAVMILDLFMPGMGGFEVLSHVARERPWLPVIVVTVSDSVDAAVQCMRQGAFDFMTKPIDRHRLSSSVSHALRVRDLEDRLVLYSGSPEDDRGPANPALFQEIVTNSPRMRMIFHYIEAIAPSPNSVLITGESGTGKELVARAVHRASARAGEFVAVNVAGLDDAMLSDTLFGHHRGAFTGADKSRSGLVERAAEGTLFLDEIGDLDPASQTKLLRLLQEGEYYPLGSDRPSHAKLRVVAATNADMQQRQRDGRFRKDLYYRLISHRIDIPPLRERPEDIEALASLFARRTAESIGRDEPRLSRAAHALLRSYSFPGNVRELQAIMADAVSRATGVVTADLLRDRMHTSGHADNARVAPTSPDPDDSTQIEGRFWWQGAFPRLDEVEELLIAEALRRSNLNQSAAARMLGVSQSTLSRRLNKRQNR